MLNPEIGFWGGMALLVSSITGPGLTTVPLIFQQAGWLLPVLAFVVVGVLSGAASLFLVEAMGHIRGNEKFQAQVEFTTIAELCLGKRSHLILQIILFLALQSVNISSIIISAQSMDTILIQLFNKTCAVSFTQGWICETSVSSTSGSPFTSYIFVSFGYLISVVLVLPLSVLRLGQNIFVQLVSAVTLIGIFIIWIVVFLKHGINNHIPAVGPDGSQLVGFVVSNFAFVTTVPSFVNELSRKVSIHRVIWVPVVFCTSLYIILGLLGAASYHLDDTSNILATISSTDSGTALHVLSVLINVLFPLSVLVTSIPIFSIVIRYNLIRGKICSKPWALFWAAFFPWILVIPFQTMGWLNIIVNWGSLLFASSANFVIPFLLYFASRRHRAITLPDRAEDGANDFPLRRLPIMNRSISEETSHRVGSFGLPHSASPSSRSMNSTGERVGEPAKTSAHEHLPMIVIDTNEIVPLAISPVSDVRTSPHSPTSFCFPEQLYLPQNTVKRRRSTRSQNSIDIGKIAEIATKSTSAENRVEEGQGQRDSIPETGSIEANRSDASDERASISSSHASVPSFSQAHILRSQIADTGLGDGALFRAFPERKYLRSVVLAQVGFLIMTLLVLGNLIYTIVETTKHNPGVGTGSK